MAKRVRPARAYQRKDEPIRLLAQAGKVRVRRAIKGALSHLRDIAPEATLTHALRSGSYDQVKDRLDWAHFREVLKGVFAEIARVRDAGAALGVRKINGSFHGGRRRVRFRKGEEAVDAPQFYSSAGWVDLEKKGAPAYPKGWSAKSREETPKEGGRQTLAPLADLQTLFDDDAVSKAGIGERFNFDRFDIDTQERIRNAQDALIRQLTTDARDTIDAVVLAGVRAGDTPAGIVGDIRALIGLTDTQASAVMNYRSMLEGLDGGALRRQLRNDELDADIRAAIDAGIPLEDAFIDRAVRDYEENYLDHRAETIAQTETTRAASAGLQDSYEQAIDRGALPTEAVRRFWQVDLDERTCPVCLSIPDENPDGVPVDTPFESIDGPIDEPPVHPNCRCSIDYVTDLDKVPDDQEQAA